MYDGNVVKYLIVPKDVEIPAGLDKDMIVIQLPVEKTYVASEDALKLLDEQLDAAESIKAVGMEQKDCQIENIAKAMEDKKISFDGAFDDLDYKALEKTKSTLQFFRLSSFREMQKMRKMLMQPTRPQIPKLRIRRTIKTIRQRMRKQTKTRLRKNF